MDSVMKVRSQKYFFKNYTRLFMITRIRRRVHIFRKHSYLPIARVNCKNRAQYPGDHINIHYRKFTFQTPSFVLSR